MTRLLLSFSSAYAELARRVAGDLRAAKLYVRNDQWEGGGGAPVMQSEAGGVGDAQFVLPLLSPSTSSPSWIGEEWQRAVYDQAMARGVPVLPLRGDGDVYAIPDFLRDRSFADLRTQYSVELRRVIETIRHRSGDASIELPDVADAASTLALAEHPIAIDVHPDLSRLVERLSAELIPQMRDGLFYELGVRFPNVQLRVDASVPPLSARIVLHEIPETVVKIWPGLVMVSESVARLAKRGIGGQNGMNPATGAESAWVAPHHAEELVASGLYRWDEAEFLVLSLTAVLRKRAAQFITIDETQALLDMLRPVFPQLVAQTVPATVSLFVLTDVLRRLVEENVSIRNLRKILMAMAEWGRVERDPMMLTDYVRAHLNRQITHMVSHAQNTVLVLLIHPDIEATIRASFRYTAAGVYADLEPGSVRALLDRISIPMKAIPDFAELPVILTTMELRSFIRRLVSVKWPRLQVICYQDLTPGVDIQPAGRIEVDGFKGRKAHVDDVTLWG